MATWHLGGRREGGMLKKVGLGTTQTLTPPTSPSPPPPPPSPTPLHHHALLLTCHHHLHLPLPPSHHHPTHPAKHVSVLCLPSLCSALLPFFFFLLPPSCPHTTYPAFLCPPSPSCHHLCTCLLLLLVLFMHTCCSILWLVLTLQHTRLAPALTHRPSWRYACMPCLNLYYVCMYARSDPSQLVVGPMVGPQEWFVD